ncbi:histone-lysine N-methyltransferase SETDB2-like [Pristis pectinata]|uniref:histone-lysine N-methyltransferase SETDB2-like n=1 Tax=Pristis pectinata TaxID=685728 RepID=UPI00223C99F5|nr:histone-lysine N-methyltransferase SETDB2-like [Pristis pectinata]
MASIPERDYLEHRAVNTEKVKGSTAELLQSKKTSVKGAETEENTLHVDSHNLEKAKLFWSKMQASGNVELVFEQLINVLNCLKKKIANGSANNQEYLKALNLLNKAGIYNNSLSPDTPENEETFQFDCEEISEKVTISEEVEAKSVSDNSQLSRTSVIKSVAPSVICPSPAKGFNHPSLPDLIIFHQHKCSRMCIAGVMPPTSDHFKGENPLRIPILCQFQRRHAKLHWDTEVLEPPHVSYKAPCGRSLRNFKEVRNYIFETQCDFLLLDFFSFNTYVQLSRTFPCKNPIVYKADISRGIESVPVPLYNAIDISTPEYFKYRKVRLPHGYLISNSAEMFQQKCNCTDGCSDKSRCACQQLTAKVNKRFGKASGYEYKRLLQSAPSGLYECNKWCKCNKILCENRVVQQGLTVRLQLFKTHKKGWGVRCMDDVDKGTFVCCYAGRILSIANGTESQKNDKTINFNDTDSGSSKKINTFIKRERKESVLESEHKSSEEMEETKISLKKEEATSFVKTSPLITQKGHTELSGRKKPGARKSDLHDSESTSIKRPKTKTALLQAQRRKLQEQGQILVMHSSSEEDESESSAERPKRFSRTFQHSSPKKRKTLSDNQPINSDKGVTEKRSSDDYGRSHSTPLSGNIFECPLFSQQTPQETDKQENNTNNENANTQNKLIPDNNHKGLVSKLHRIGKGDDQGDCCYFLDATEEGNIGRFLNHSCDPNLMVQSVFVDTHDKNFPWVAFFTNRYIKAGSELTWDYSYSVGTIPEEEIPCFCGSIKCRNLISKIFTEADLMDILTALTSFGGECFPAHDNTACQASIMPRLHDIHAKGTRTEESILTGKLFTDGNFAVHQNCLLFSSNLVNQNSQDFDDFGGFYLKDIKKEIKRGSKLKCSSCRRKGATVGCEVETCKKSYHYPCASDDDAKIIEDEVLGIYRVYCKIHKKGERPKPSGTSSRGKIARSRTDNGIMKAMGGNNLREVSHLDKFQPKTSESIKGGAAIRKRANSSDTDESDDLPIFTGTHIQPSAKSRNGSKQMKFENEAGKQNELFCNSSSSHAERMDQSSDEWSLSLLATDSPGGNQEARSNETIACTGNLPFYPPLTLGEKQTNDGNCSDASTNIDQEIDDMQQNVQKESTGGTSTAITEPHELSATGQAQKFWKMCKEAQCLEKIFLTIQKDLNSIQRNIANENATNKDYEIAWAILLTMNSLQDIMSEFQSGIQQNLQRLEEEKLSLQKRECLIEELAKLAHSLTSKADR